VVLVLVPLVFQGTGRNLAVERHRGAPNGSGRTTRPGGRRCCRG
jgi:hypothetical protein